MQKGLNMEDERRVFARYIVKKDELQAFSHDLKIVGKLNDISKGGLSFRYTPIVVEKLDTHSINILARGTDRSNLFDIACQIIYDISTLEEGQSFTGAASRQFGIKFLGLMENQQNQLELLLKNFTV
jgi:hypothetical protein